MSDKHFSYISKKEISYLKSILYNAFLTTSISSFKHERTNSFVEWCKVVDSLYENKYSNNGFLMANYSTNFGPIKDFQSFLINIESKNGK